MMITNAIGTADVRPGDTPWRRDVTGASLCERGSRTVAPAAGRMIGGFAQTSVRTGFKHAKQARPPRGVPR